MKNNNREESLIIKTFSFFRSFFVVAGWTSLSRISGVVREMFFANIFGASAFSDIYAFAIKLPNFFRRFFAEGALNAVLVPKFSTLIASKDEEIVRKFAKQMFSVLVVGLFFFVLVFEIGMPVVVKTIAPGFRHNQFMYTNVVHFSRIMFPYIWFISIVALMSGLLNSMNHFSWPAAISIIANVSMIFALIIGKLLGNNVSLNFVMHLLSISVIFGGILQCIALWFDCRRNGVILRFSKPEFTPEIRKVLKASVPGMVGASVTQINIFVDMAFASLLPVGSVSYLNFADRLNQLPLSLFGSALGITLLPLLSKYWKNNEVEKAHQTQINSLVFGMLFVIPATIGMFVLAEPIVGLLYGHGRFDKYAIIQTMLALKAFVLGLPFYVLAKVFSTIFFANRDTRTPVIIAAISVFTNALLNYILKQHYAHVGIASATTISAFINAVICGAVLYKRKLFFVRKKEIITIAKIILASLMMGIVVFRINVNTPSYGDSIMREFIYTMAPIIFGIVLYVILIFLLKVKINKK